MIDINRKKELRYLFLQQLYELTDGSEIKRIEKDEIAKRFSISPQEAHDIWQYLKGENLASPVNMVVSITHRGIMEIESSLSEPDEPTHYFPPLNIITVHQMHGSVIQQGNVNSTQSAQLTNTNKGKISDFLGELNSALPHLSLSGEANSEMSADIATIAAQIGSERPKTGIIKESLLSIQRVLEGAGGAIVAQQLLLHIPPLLSALAI